MFWRIPSLIHEFCRMQNQVWMIEFSYECDFRLHNAWLLIPCVFLCFIEMISDKHTWRRLIWFTYGRELVVRWAGPFLVLSFCLQHSDSCMIFSRQPFFDLCWFLVDELVFIRDANSSSFLMVFVFWRGEELFFFVC